MDHLSVENASKLHNAAFWQQDSKMSTKFLTQEKATGLSYSVTSNRIASFDVGVVACSV